MNPILKSSAISKLLLMAVIFFYAATSSAQYTTDYASETPIINSNPLPKYSLDSLDYSMTIGIERTAKGRIWGAWVAGGDNEDAFFVLATSDNQGKIWSSPRMVIDPHDTKLPEKRRALVGTLWLDPLNRLWLFFDQALTYFDGRAGNWYTICENPDADNPTWSAPQRIWHGATLNKPAILKDGTWALPVSLWDRKKIKSDLFKTSYQELDSLRGAHLFTSVDSGKTWIRQGKVTFPSPQFDEHHITELTDGRLWMTARTAIGMHQSFSSDKGKTWSKPEFYMPHIGSRHVIKRLKSGKLLLIKHGELNEKTRTRSKMYAYLSDDEGKTWYGKLSIDERRGISYPDGFEDPKGNIFISYDRNRDTDGQILMVKFTEKDIVNQKVIDIKDRIVIAQPRGLDKKQ
ncbi:MAG: sialidase family protein [Pedobacter sp.]|uniref:sialidase family protein n=1 Tax=Pedobacter sp. TaxID=1411316 RepID=UPI002806E129|nr:sialidase family protein [Pedobacter sp.]MDQ8006061.1 sialidase family protein [Pedobacter sp.]